MASIPPIVLKELGRKLSDSNGAKEKLMQHEINIFWHGVAFGLVS